MKAFAVSYLYFLIDVPCVFDMEHCYFKIPDNTKK